MIIFSVFKHLLNDQITMTVSSYRSYGNKLSVSSFNDLGRGRRNRLRIFLRVNVTMRKQEPGCISNLRNRA